MSAKIYDHFGQLSGEVHVATPCSVVLECANGFLSVVQKYRSWVCVVESLCVVHTLCVNAVQSFCV